MMEATFGLLVSVYMVEFGYMEMWGESSRRGQWCRWWMEFCGVSQREMMETILPRLCTRLLTIQSGSPECRQLQDS